MGSKPIVSLKRTVLGYFILNPDMTDNSGLRYSVGKNYHLHHDIVLGFCGFHIYNGPSGLKSINLKYKKVFLAVGWGNTASDICQTACSHIRLLREISQIEMKL